MRFLSSIETRSSPFQPSYERFYGEVGAVEMTYSLNSTSYEGVNFETITLDCRRSLDEHLGYGEFYLGQGIVFLSYKGHFQ